MRSFLLHKLHELYLNSDVLSGFSTAFILHMNINWADKIVGFCFSISAGLTTAWLVSLLKQYKEKQEKKKQDDEKI